ncbi:hypothetical protein TNCV_3214461 [Trichonephila clavipes]|nr:hypothetical protein TNCV_3214461 [Trichonephila clavipes]
MQTKHASHLSASRNGYVHHDPRHKTGNHIEAWRVVYSVSGFMSRYSNACATVSRKAPIMWHSYRYSCYSSYLFEIIEDICCAGNKRLLGSKSVINCIDLQDRLDKISELRFKDEKPLKPC